MALVKRSIEESSLGASAEPDLDMAHLERSLSADDATTRRSAARLLAEQADAVPLLCRHLEREPALSVRNVIFNGLVRQASSAAAAGLLPLLRSEDASLRNGAIEALQEMPDALAPHIEHLLSDADSDVRVLTVNVLAALRHPSVSSWLRQVISNDPHVNVCAAAVDALAETGEEPDIALLDQLPARFPGVPFIAYASAAAIRRIRGV